MAENLRTTKYNDGTPIQYVQDWRSEKDQYCWYDHDENYKKPFGALYNWYVVDSEKLAPEGWRVATYYDWDELMAFLGGKLIAGGKMKKRGDSIWEEPNKLVEPDCGFNAYPGGYVWNKFIGLHSNALWWSFGEFKVYYTIDNINTSLMAAHEMPRTLLLSVRCIKK
jgi:uncharacterized protein (TIGR02145 family)